MTIPSSMSNFGNLNNTEFFVSHNSIVPHSLIAAIWRIIRAPYLYAFYSAVACINALSKQLVATGDCTMLVTRPAGAFSCYPNLFNVCPVVLDKTFM